MVQDWHSEDCSLKIIGVEVLALDEFEADPGDEITHIETSQGVTGYNEGYQKPKWSAKIKVTNVALGTLEDYRINKTEGAVVFVAPGYTVTVTGARISTIKPAGGLKDAPQVSIDGLGLSVSRAFTE